MRAAIYARKSTDQLNVADEQRSVTRQIEHARSYASRHGWTTDEAHVYCDDGISGAEFSARPGFVRLLNAVRPRAPFDVLIVSELSRLGREQLETGYALKQLSQAGVRIFSYLEDREILLDTPTSKFLMSAVSFAAEVEREKARQRVTDAMVRRAQAGHVTGGRAFGYDNVTIFGPDGRRSHVERRVNEAEAAVLRRIFQLCAKGHGLKSIAKLLNAAGALAPTPARGRPKGWAPSSVRAALYRRTYLGELRYLATRKRDGWGQRRTLRRPSSDLIVVSQPAWRIVSDAEWEAAHARLSATTSTFSGTHVRAAADRPAPAVHSKYLLSGLARCSVCGGSMAAHVTSQQGRNRWPYYRCSTFSNRGAAVCGNTLRLPMKAADDAVLELFERVVLNVDVIDAAITEAVRRIHDACEVSEPRRAAILSDLARLAVEQQRYAQAIASAGDLAVLTAALREREQQRLRLQEELAAMERPRTQVPDATQLQRALRARLGEWKALLREHAPSARTALSKLIDGRLTFWPEPEMRRYRISGTATLGPFLEAVVQDRSVPLGWCARRDLNPRPTGSKPAALSS